jgi:hypothetical protein
VVRQLDVHQDMAVAKFLGAAIGLSDADEEGWIKARAESMRRWFENLASLPATYAWSLLSTCGISKWNHYVRTHSPWVTRIGCEIFDGFVKNAFAKILSVNADNLPLPFAFPVARGGVGLVATSWIREAAYTASVEECFTTDKKVLPQKGRAEQVIDQKATEHYDQLPPPGKLHLQYCQHPDSFLPFKMGTDHNLNDQEFVVAMKIRLGMPVSPPVGFTCPGCGVVSASDEVVGHLLTCNKNKVNTRQHLHEEVVKEYKSIAKDCGVTCTEVGAGYSTEDGRIPDLIFYRTSDRAIVIDVSVVWTTAPSYVHAELGKFAASLDQRHHHKMGKHGAAADSNGHELHSAVFAGLGACHDDVIVVLKALQRETGAEDLVTHAKRRLLVALQRGVARLVLSALSRSSR